MELVDVSSEAEQLEVVSIEPRTHKLERYKYHVDMSEDTDVKELTTKYEDTNNYSLEKIDKEDVHRILKKYSNNPQMDLYTIAECFSIGATSLNRILKTDEFRDEYQAIKKQRGEMFVQEGYKTACTPFDKIQRGEEVSMVEVSASKLKSNYCLAMGRALNPEFNPQKDGVSESGGINVVVNTGIKLNV